MENTVLYIDDEKENLKAFRFAFMKSYKIFLADSTKEAEKLMLEHQIKVVVTDQRMPEETGTAFIQRVRHVFPSIVFIILTGYSDMDVVIEAINMGEIYRYLTKPLKEPEMRQAIDNAIDRYNLQLENEDLMKQLHRKNKLLLDKILQLERTNEALFESRRELNMKRKELEKNSVVLKDSYDRLKEASKRSEKSRRLLQKIVDSYPNSYLSVVEKNFTISFSGGQEFVKNNIDPEQFNGIHIREIFEEDADFVIGQYLKVFQGEEISFELFFNSQYQLYRAVPISDPSGEVLRILTIVENVTKRKEQEIELLQAKEKAEESDKLKTEFLNNISHEIRTPMNGILGFANLLRKSNVDLTMVDKYANIIEENGKQLLNTVEAIIEISRLETEQVKPNYTSIKLNAFLEKELEHIKKQTKNKELDWLLCVNVPKKQNHFVTDVSLLNKALKILLHNAAKFTLKGKVELGCSLEEDMLLFYVEDTGPGIPKEKQDLIFERFSQVADFSTREHGGLGLGLTIAQRYIRLLGGEINLSSESEKGAKFWFRLPFRFTENKSKKEVKLKQGAEEHFDPDKAFRILIVEDEMANFLFVETLLQALGGLKFEVVRATNGAEAVNLFKGEERFDLVLMDIRMPVLDGIEAAKIIKQKVPDQIIVVQTAFTEKSERERAIDAGCDDFVTKPITEKIFLSILDTYLPIEIAVMEE